MCQPEAVGNAENVQAMPSYPKWYITGNRLLGAKA